MSAEHRSLEERLAALEQEVAELRHRIPPSRVKVPPTANWVEAVSGSLEDFPEFEQVLEYGRQIRRQQLTP
jgi:hypothetical protein